jgi:hypothetical protein
LCGEEGRCKENSGGDEGVGAHRDALIHREGREVNRWSYQFSIGETGWGCLKSMIRQELVCSVVRRVRGQR